MLKKPLFRVDETYFFSNSFGYSFKNTLQQHEILIIFTSEDKV